MSMSDFDAEATQLLNGGLHRLADSYRRTAAYCQLDKRPEKGLVYEEMARRVDVLRDAAGSMFTAPETAVAEILDGAYSDHMALANPVEAMVYDPADNRKAEF